MDSQRGFEKIWNVWNKPKPFPNEPWKPHWVAVYDFLLSPNLKSQVIYRAQKGILEIDKTIGCLCPTKATCQQKLILMSSRQVSAHMESFCFVEIAFTTDVSAFCLCKVIYIIQ